MVSPSPEPLAEHPVNMRADAATKPSAEDNFRMCRDFLVVGNIGTTRAAATRGAWDVRSAATGCGSTIAIRWGASAGLARMHHANVGTGDVTYVRSLLSNTFWFTFMTLSTIAGPRGRKGRA